MRKQILAAALVAVLGLTACEQKPSATYSPSSGSLALSRDDKLLYAVDADNGIVAVVDTDAHTKIAEVKVGTTPERITVGPDDTIYVSNTAGRNYKTRFLPPDAKGQAEQAFSNIEGALASVGELLHD